MSLTHNAVLPDKGLLGAYLAGEELAFEVLVTRYQNRLVNYINNIVGDYDRAVDLCQETFIRVFKFGHRYRGEYQFSTWLYRIATNLACDELRKRQGKNKPFFFNVMSFHQSEEGAIPIRDSRWNPERTVESQQKAQHLRSAICSLPDTYKFAFVLREVQRLSIDETADILNVRPGTVKSRVHRAKRLLREKLSGLI